MTKNSIPTFVYDNRGTVEAEWDPLQKLNLLPNVCAGITLKLTSYGSLLLNKVQNGFDMKIIHISEVTEWNNIFYLVEPWPDFKNDEIELGGNIGSVNDWIDVLDYVPKYIIQLAKLDRLTILISIPERFPINKQWVAKLSKFANTNSIESNFKLITSMKYDHIIPYVYYYPMLELEYKKILPLDLPSKISLEQREKKFTFLSNMDKLHRRCVAADLWKAGLHTEGYFGYAFQVWDPTYEINTRISDRTITSPHYYAEFQKVWPPSLMEEFFDQGIFSADDWPVEDYRIKHCYSIEEHYTNSYWNIFGESTYQDDLIFFTEKTWKPIANLQPFIIIGNPYSLKELRQLGYQTFGDYIDESYDMIHNQIERIKAVSKLVIWLASQSHEWHMDIMQKIEPILIHNRNHFMREKPQIFQVFIDHLNNNDQDPNWTTKVNYAKFNDKPTFVFDSWADDSERLNGPYKELNLKPNVCQGVTGRIYGHASLLLQQLVENADIDIIHISEVIEWNNIFYLIEPWPDFNFEGANLIARYDSSDWANVIRYIPQNIVDLSNANKLTILFHLPEFFIDEKSWFATLKANAQERGLIDIKCITGNKNNTKYKHSYYFPTFETCHKEAMHIGKEDLIPDIFLGQREKKFTFLTRFDKIHRRVVATALWKAGLHTEGYFGYAFMQFENNSCRIGELTEYPIHYRHEMWNYPKEDLIAFQSAGPFKADDMEDFQFLNHQLVIKDHFANAYWNIVGETGWYDSGVFISEKTWKPIANFQPFIIIGNPHFLKELHNLGYQTFGDYIDESYDDIEDPVARIMTVSKLAIWLASQSHEWHINLMYKIAPILAHNRAHFFKNKPNRLSTFLRYMADNNQDPNWILEVNYD